MKAFSCCCWACGPQLLPQVFQSSILPVGGDLVERHPVAAGGTVVTPACPVGFFEDVGPTHLVPQRIESKVRFGPSFRLQRGLSFLNSFERSCWAIGQSPRSHHFSRLAHFHGESNYTFAPRRPDG
jgi:hypothetical protein